MRLTASAVLLVCGLLSNCLLSAQSEQPFVLNNKGYFENEGANVFVFNTWYNGLFGDEKTSGIVLIHHDVRTATNGDVRLNPTPDQWDPIPVFVDKKIDKDQGLIEAKLKYPDYGFEYKIIVKAVAGGAELSVVTDKPVPEKLVGVAGFNLEFLPSAYFETSYLMDGKTGLFPLYPSGPMSNDLSGRTDPLPLARGKRLVLAPEDPLKCVTIEAVEGGLELYDGRNKAQNGWFVVRTMLPAYKTGEIVKWLLIPNTVEGWTRQPVISYNQLGYHPVQPKIAVIESDVKDLSSKTIQLIKIDGQGGRQVVKESVAEEWGIYLRYKYARFDFTEQRDPGLYCLKMGEHETKTFQIREDIFQKAWQPSLDIYLPVQMDHMMVNEAYRVWHGRSHLDDALQAPVNHKHFDLYGQGPTTDTPYKPGEHIPGLNIGGWYDAGDFDIRTQTQYHTVIQLVDAWETFRIDRDETLIDQSEKYVDLHHPDGTPDILQQIEHGTLALIAQHRACGHAIAGIIESHLSQYHHLGDPVNKTDNLIYNPGMAESEKNVAESGLNDDRWAFTSKSTPLNYGSAAGLAAAARALKGYNDKLADECLITAVKVWDEEHSHKPDIYYVGNTTGGELQTEELTAAIELLITTGDLKYASRISELYSELSSRFDRYTNLFVKAIPFMDEDYKAKIREQAISMRKRQKEVKAQNPFEVPITTGGWAGNGQVMQYAVLNYRLHKAFPDIYSAEPVFAGLNYILGCHPASNISFVSGVGTVSKKVAYGMNRADFSFIAGGIVPGVLVFNPDFPENKEDWPFFWGENEYVVNMSATWIYLVNAVNDLLGEPVPEAQSSLFP
jgi:endoglucanase